MHHLISLSLLLISVQFILTTASTEGTQSAEQAVSVVEMPSSGCASCSAPSRQRSPQEVQQEKLRLEQDKILSKLRLQKPPTVHFSMSDLPPPLIRRLKEENEQLEKNAAKLNSFYALSHYPNGVHGDAIGELRRMAEDEDRDDPMIAKTKGLYIFGQRPRTGGAHTFNCPSSNGRVAGCIEFDLNSQLFTRRIVKASLWLYTSLEGDKSSNRSLVITEIQRTHAHQTSYQERWLTDHSLNDDHTDGWVEVEFTDQVSSWSNPGENKRLKRLRISCNTCSNSAHPPIAISHRRLPFLEIKLGKLIPGDQSRNRRSSTECSPHLYNNCCLKPFYVNFTEIGWNSWILQPPGYYANYCTGSCRMTATTSYNNIIRNVGNTKEAKGEVVDKELVPCCAPTKMMALSLLYAFSPGEIMKTTLQNMIVESCGC